jgi:3-hydroxy acid dehydrogenase / malonic semialdehyde reductase
MLPNDSAVNSGPLTVGSMTLIFSAAEVNKFSHSYYLVLMKNKIALVTGASSGIGRACALTVAKMGYDLIATGRRAERLEELGLELPEGVRFLPLVFDVRDRKDVDRLLTNLPSDWVSIDVLINNAGNAHGLDPIQTGNVDDWDAMIDINVKGLLYVSKAIIPGMTERNSGHIINIGSIAGKEVYPNGNVYCASKHAVDALTNGMRMDLNPFGIKVMGIHPGLVETEFSLVRFKGDEKRAGTVYQGYSPLLAQDIADIVEFALTRPPHVVLADVVVLPTAQASATVIKKKLPQ